MLEEDLISPAVPIAARVPEGTMVIGATGFLGRHLVAWLAAAGRPPLAIGRRPATAALPPGVSTLRIDAADTAELTRAVPAGAMVVNLAHDGRASAAENMAAARAILAACARAGARRLLHVSTCGVAGGARGRWLDETTPCAPLDPYQRIKWEVEEMLRRDRPRELELVVLRPSSVFGAGGLALRKMALDLLAGSAAKRWLRRSLLGRRPMNLVSVSTVSAAIAHLLALPMAGPEALFIVAEDEEPGNRLDGVESVVAAALGVSPLRLPPLPLPLAVAALVLRIAGWRGGDVRARFSSARLRASGFEPPRPFHAALTSYAGELGAELRRGARV